MNNDKLFAACDHLVKEGVDMWALAEYILLGEESTAGRQDAAWETRWHTLCKKSGTCYVNKVYKYGYEYVLTSAGIFEYISKKGL